MRVLVVLAGLSVAAAGCERGDAGSPGAGGDGATPGTVYGKGLSGADTLTVAQLLAAVDEHAGETVRVEGLITEVCPRRGCWIKLAGEEGGEDLTFKVQDGVIVFPLGAAGKYAVAEGVVVKRELSLEQTREVLGHEAEETGREFDPATVTEPMTYVRLDGTGAVVRDRK